MFLFIVITKYNDKLYASPIMAASAELAIGKKDIGEVVSVAGPFNMIERSGVSGRVLKRVTIVNRPRITVGNSWEGTVLERSAF